MCGEKEITDAEGATETGSPPRVRGKGRRTLLFSYSIGITPAFAGKSVHLMHERKPVRDHPRVCGEKQKTFSIGQCVTGSPPRVRGKGRARAEAGGKARITPACAGKRSRG